MTPMPFAAPLARALMRSQSDERLVKLAQEGHEGAFDEIVRRYRPPLVAFAAAYAPAGRAEDVVQEGLANAWVSLEGSNREVALKPWLYTIVRNRALNAQRDTRHHSELDETIDGVLLTDQIVLERDELARAVAAIAVLPEAQRKALVESAIEGRTHDQIAAELNTSAASVRGLVHRGRVAVRGAVGALVPLPVVAWAAGSGAVAGGVAAGSAVGGSLAAKGAAVATIAVLAAGSGIVVESSLDDEAQSEREASAAQSKGGDREGSGNDGPGHDDPGSRSGPGGDIARHDGDNEGHENEDGDDSGPSADSGPSGGGDNSGPGGGGDDNSGPGSGSDEDGGGTSGPSGGGSSNSGPGSESSGSGSSGSDSSGSSGSSGSGSSVTSGSSGSGSSSSGSGSGGSGFDDDFDGDTAEAAESVETDD